jgi:hypothetical protein
MKKLVAKTMIKNVRELVKYFGLKYKFTSFQVLSLLVNQHQVSTLKKTRHFVTDAEAKKASAFSPQKLLRRIIFVG